MKTRFVKYVLLLAAVSVIATGCLSSMTVRQGTKAYLYKDYATAKAKYEEAIEAGNADAMYHLAVMYAEGKGVQQDYAKAAALLQQAVAQEQEDAQLMLGLFYVYGDGVEMNPAKGAELVKASAVNGNDVAMYYLGTFYAKGVGVPKDIAMAKHWMQEAKDSGFPVKPELLTDAGLMAL